MKNLYRQRPFTVFIDFSDKRLKNLFSRDSWLLLNKYQRLDLLQEVSNRRAQRLNMSYYPRVSFQKMQASTSGQYFDGRIILNEERYGHDKPSIIDDKGSVKEIGFEYSNFDAFETLIHEHQHAYQEECIDGKIEEDIKYIENLNANNGFLARNDNHSLYISSKSNYQIYRLQISERDAFRVSEKETDSLIASLEKEGRLSNLENQKSLMIYKKMRDINGQNAIEEEASLFFGREKPELVVDKTLVDLKNGNLDENNLTKLEKETLEATKDSYRLCFSENLEKENKVELEGQYRIRDLPKLEELEKNPIKEELREENRLKNGLKIGGIL